MKILDILKSNIHKRMGGKGRNKVSRGKGVIVYFYR